MPSASVRMLQRNSSVAQIERNDIWQVAGYDETIAAFERKLLHWDSDAERGLVDRHAPWNEVQVEVERVAGRYGLIILSRTNQGPITSLAGEVKHSTLYLVGNPVIASRILNIDVRAGMYVPFRVFVYQPTNGGDAVVAFDRPSSSLATLRNPELFEIGKYLDQKIEEVIAALRDE